MACQFYIKEFKIIVKKIKEKVSKLAFTKIESLLSLDC
jgi:hypothetical protein